MNLSIRKLQKLLANKELNPYIDIENTDKVFLHLTEELGEAISDYLKDKKDELRYELGDIQILLCFVAESLHIDLDSATLDKLILNIQTGKFRATIGDLLK